MKFKKLIIENFRGFYGRHEIDFCNEDGSLNLIIAENEVGKTSLLNAVLWCLYDHLTKTSDRKDLIKNTQAKQDESCKVEVHLGPMPGKDKNDWLCLRRQITKGSKKSVPRAFDVNHVTEKETQRPFGEAVNQFLHQSLSKYYLFDGEGVHEILENENLLKSAILDIQGLNIAKRCLSDLKNYRDKKQAVLTKEQSQSNKGEQYASHNQELRGKVETINGEIDGLEGKTTEWETLRSQLRSEINDLGGDEIQKLISEQKELEKTILPEAKRKVSLFENQRRGLIKEFGISIMGYNHIDSVNKWINIEEKTTGIPSHYEEAFIDGLEESGKCICGESFENHKKDKVHKARYDNIMNLRKDAKTDSIKVGISDIQALAKHIRKTIPAFNQKYEDTNTELDIRIKELKKRRDRFEEINGILSGSPEDEIAKRQSQIQKLKTKIQSNFTEIGAKKRDMRNMEITIKENENALKKINKNTFLEYQQKEIDFLQETINFLDELINETQAEGRKKIEVEMNDLLKNYARGDDSFEFRQDSYSPRMVSRGFEEIDKTIKGDIKVLSQGGSAVKRNLFFAVALTKISEIQSDLIDEYRIPGKKIPFFIDAPFSNLDSTNTSNAFKLLVENAFQLVLLISSSAFNNGIQELLEDREYKKKLKKIYVLKRYYKGKLDTKNKDAKETPIIIKGKSYQTSFYDSEVETTKIEDFTKKFGIRA